MKERVNDQALSEKQLKKHYKAFLPADLTSSLDKAVLPGEVGIAEEFGATYKNLEYHELWDRMWRNTDQTDIVVKFDHSPVSVVYWRGTNFAANWITDNNRWMADQSSEIFTLHGCSEHMSDKQTRHSYARIIENNDARVIVHWRYPCVDVGHAASEPPVVTMNGKILTGKELKIGYERDTSGKLQWVIWIPMSSTGETTFEIQ
jgi:hypothetical protein